jgi:hypothetical protein
MLMKYLIPSCRDTAYLVSRSMDGDISRFQRFRVWLHQRLCPPCADNGRHLKALHRHAGPCLAHAYEAMAHTASLSPRARATIFGALKEACTEEKGGHVAH